MSDGLHPVPPAPAVASISWAFRPLSQEEAERIAEAVAGVLRGAIGQVVSLELLREGETLFELRLLKHGVIATEVNHG